MPLVDGNTIPQLGLGVYKVENELAAPLVAHALENGYRLIDTASMYENEVGVGEGIRASGLPREEVIVATKFWMDGLGFENTLKEFDKSLKALKLDYLDLYLIAADKLRQLDRPGYFNSSKSYQNQILNENLIQFHHPNPDRCSKIDKNESGNPRFTQKRMIKIKN